MVHVIFVRDIYHYSIAIQTTLLFNKGNSKQVFNTIEYQRISNWGVHIVAITHALLCRTPIV